MPSRLWGAIVALGFLMICLLVGVLGWTPPNRRVTLGNGSIREILGLTREPAPPPEQGPLYRRFLGRHLPDGLRDRLKWDRPRIYSSRTGGDALICWQQQPAKDKAANVWLSGVQWIEDRHGCRVPGEQELTHTGDREGIAAIFTTFPRREEVFTMVLPVDGKTAARTVLVSLPHRSYPHWAATVLPTKWSDGKLEARLLTFRGGRISLQQGVFPEQQGVELTFQVKVNGRLSSDWQPANITLRDATGNVVDPFEFGGYMFEAIRPGEWRATGMNRLCLKETWEVDLTLEQVRGFAQADLWTFRNIRVPDLYRSADVNQIAYSRGVPLRLDFVVKEREDGLTVPLKAPPHLEEITLVDATDARGRSVSFSYQYGVITRRPDNMGFEIPWEVKQVNLAFARPQKAKVRFRAQPQAVGLTPSAESLDRP
jgi:hypothetical protein